MNSLIRLITLLLTFISMTAMAGEDIVRLGSTTSVRSSGLLDALKPAFEHDTGLRLQTTATGSGKALQLARNGNFDILIVHAPQAEQSLIEQGYAEKREPLMRNFFLIVGPASDPADLKHATDATDGFRRIASSKSLFFSRADDSGTHRKELGLWKKAGIAPIGAWYYESGLGVGALLNLANEQQGYTLVDHGSWLANRKSISLRVLLQDHQRLDNTYSLLTLSHDKLPQLNHPGASVFARWLLSDKGRAIISGLVIDGQPLFTLITP